MKTKSLLLATALLMSTSALAQKNTFKGVVLDDLGEPVIGATVQVKGVKGAGAITDLDGNFVIDADANQTLVITYIGYKDAEIRPSANMKITLKQDDKALDEVVVVGYGVQKKSDVIKTFFANHTILNILTRYCIFTSENMLMVMRPYQITATERILNRIEIANNYRNSGALGCGQGAST